MTPEGKPFTVSGITEPSDGFDFAACYPGFRVTCEKCESARCYTESSMGWSELSGGWGSFDLVCSDCGNRTILLDS